MISFIKNQFAQVQHTFFDNALCQYRWMRSSFYTWFNLTALFALLLILCCSIVRFIHYLEVRSLLADCPDYQRELMADALSEGWEFALFAGIPELLWFWAQYSAFALLFVLLLLSMAWDLWLWHQRRWDHPESPHIRILPVSPGQAQFALADLRFFVMLSCVIGGMLLLLLPSINLNVHYFDLQFGLGYEITERKIILHTVFLWMVIFAVYRTVQFQRFHGANLWANPMAGRWLIAFLLWLALPFCAFQIIHFLWGGAYTSEGSLGFLLVAIIFLSYYSAMAVCLLLFVSCWTLKHKLYHWQEE